MRVRTLVGVLAFTAAVYMELHRYCRRYFAEFLDAEEHR